MIITTFMMTYDINHGTDFNNINNNNSHYQYNNNKSNNMQILNNNTQINENNIPS